VGSNGEDPITSVRGADGRSGETVPDDIEPERGQVPENLSPDGSVMEGEKVRHVLDEDVSGSKLADGAPHLAPQNGLGVSESLTLAGGRGSLAGEASGDDIDGSSRSCSDCSDVVENGDAGEAEFEDRSSPGVDLAEPRMLEPGEVEAEGEHPDAVELAADCERRGAIHAAVLSGSRHSRRSRSYIEGWSSP
jgi:hypothetical protein